MDRNRCFEDADTAMLMLCMRPESFPNPRQFLDDLEAIETREDYDKFHQKYGDCIAHSRNRGYSQKPVDETSYPRINGLKDEG